MSNSLTLLTIERLLTVKQYILDNPHKFNQFCRFNCIIGRATIIFSEEAPVWYEDDVGVEKLGITQEQWKLLFYQKRWPLALSRAIEASDPFTLEHAQIAAARIDHFIATDGRE